MNKLQVGLPKFKKITQKAKSLSWYTYYRLAAYGVLALPLLFLILLLSNYAINVPFWDQWELPLILEKSAEGNLRFSDFYAQHNEHRLLFPRLIMFVLAKATHWNTYYEIGFSVILAAISFAFLYKILSKTFTRYRYLVSSALMISLLFFSPLQWENWLWGWQIQWFMNVLAVIIVIWALTTWQITSQLKKTLVAAAAALVATYSLGSGFVIWFIAIPVFILNKELRKYTPLWGLLAILSIASHYIGYVDPAYHPSKSIFLHQPVQFIHYFVVYIARPIVFDYLLSPKIAGILFAGIIIVAGYLLKTHRKVYTRELLPWLCFGLYGAMAAASTGVSRLGLGVEQAYSNRYVTLSNFFIMAVIVGLFKVYELTPNRELPQKVIRILSVVMLSMGVLLILLNYVKGIQQMQQQHRHLVKVRQCALTAKNVEDPCLPIVYPNAKVLWPRLEYIRSINWGGL